MGFKLSAGAIESAYSASSPFVILYRTVASIIASDAESSTDAKILLGTCRTCLME